MKEITVGDRVAYSASFLRSIGALTGMLPHARGLVTHLTVGKSMTLATINWSDDRIPPRVNTKNLAIIGTPRMNAT